MDQPLLMIGAALLGSAAFAVAFRTPRRYFWLTVLIGACPFLMLKLLPPDWNSGFSSFLAALLAGCMSHLAAKVTKAPAQCFLIPGVILLVPGTYIYRAFNAAMGHRIDEALGLGLSAFAITLGVSFGVLLANWVVPSRKPL